VQFVYAIQMEFQKIRRSNSWLLMVIAPLLMVGFGTYNFVRYNDIYLRGNAIPVEKLLGQIVNFYGLLLLPLSIGVLTVWLARIEHSENNWKYLFTLPINRVHVYISKLIVHTLLVGLSMLVLYIGIISAGNIIDIGSIPYKILAVKVLGCWITSLPLLSILMLLSIRFNSTGVPVGISLAASIATVIVSNSYIGKFYFWAFPYFTLLPTSEEKDSVTLSYMIIFSLLVFLVVTAIGCKNFKNQEVH
jgi:lantibiotic transport system permease protein